MGLSQERERVERMLDNVVHREKVITHAFGHLEEVRDGDAAPETECVPGNRDGVRVGVDALHVSTGGAEPDQVIGEPEADIEGRALVQAVQCAVNHRDTRIVERVGLRYLADGELLLETVIPAVFAKVGPVELRQRGLRRSRADVVSPSSRTAMDDEAIRPLIAGDAAFAIER